MLGIGWAVLAAATCTNNTTTGGAGGSGGGAGQTREHGRSRGAVVDGRGVWGGDRRRDVDRLWAAAAARVAIHLGSTACNACASTSCCNEATGCDMPDQGGGDAAGSSGCAKLASCVSWMPGRGNAGRRGNRARTVPDCFDSCNPSHVYNVTQITNAQILIACLSNGCASTCR